MFEVKPIAAALGAELHGVDLCQDLSSDVYTEIRRLLIEHQVIFFIFKDTKIFTYNFFVIFATNKRRCNMCPQNVILRHNINNMLD